MAGNEEEVRYIERTRDYYSAMGYTKDYAKRLAALAIVATN